MNTNYLNVSDNIEIVGEVEARSEVEKKQEKMIEYIRSLRALEDAMEPYKEQKRELKAEFKEQGWLTAEEISLTVKAYRMMTAEVDMEQLLSIYEGLMTRTGRN
jgi:tRNA U34 5-carboxymethylaminomethyl modifying GTPase MnmE/TrmE